MNIDTIIPTGVNEELLIQILYIYLTLGMTPKQIASQCLSEMLKEIPYSLPEEVSRPSFSTIPKMWTNPCMDCMNIIYINTKA